MLTLFNNLNVVMPMKPVIARLTFLTFLGIATGICINAIFLQDIQVADFNANGKGQNVVLQIDKSTIKKPLQDDLTHVAAVPRNKQLDAKIRDVLSHAPTKTNIEGLSFVKEIQQRLIGIGYWPGSADGIAGPTTRAAIMAFELDKGLVQTGLCDEALLKFLRGDSAKLTRGIKSDKLAQSSQELVSALQKALTKLGYNTGSVDGIIGPLTRKRIRAFERDNKLQVTGRISGRLVETINKVQGRPLVLATIR